MDPAQPRQESPPAAQGPRRKPIWPRLALAVLSLLVADAGAGLLLLSNDRVNFRRPDPWYHHGLVPLQSGETRWGSGEPYPFATNSLGFVDREPREVALETSRRRILLLGDSFTEGIGVPYAQSFAGLLGERLADQDTEVLNAGVISFSPRLYRLRLEQLLRQVGLRFDELVLLIDVSDIQDQVLYRRFVPHEPGALERWRAAAWQRLKATSFLFNSVDSYLRAQRREAKRKLYSTRNYPPWLDYFWLDNIDTEPLADPTFLSVRLGWTSPDMADNQWAQLGVELALEDMRAVVELCREYGIRLTLGVYPWPPQIRAQERDSRQVELWKTFSAENGLEFVDLFEVFMPSADVSPEEVCERYFLEQDVHWNAAGHRLVADALEPRLRREPSGD